MSDKAVADSTCLIELDLIGQLDLLRQVFVEVFAPPAVLAEFGGSAEWLVVQSVQNPELLATLKKRLNEGEAEAIALAVELGDAFVILDEERARRIAKRMGLKVIGTIGVLLKAKEMGLVPKINPLLDALRQVQFYISDALYQEALSRAGEEN